MFGNSENIIKNPESIQVQIQQAANKKERDSGSSYEEFEAFCRELDAEYGIEPLEINQDLLKPLKNEKLFAPADWVTEKYDGKQK